MSDELKSALELAMEKLGASEEPLQPLSDEQKTAIAEIRSRFKAKIAEAEIGTTAQIRAAAVAGDGEKIQQLRGQLVVEKQRLNEKMEEAVEKVRSGQ